MIRTFPIRPIARRTDYWFAAIVVFLGALAFVEIGLSLSKNIPGLWIGVTILGLVTLLIVYSWIGARRAVIELGADSFRIRGDLYRKRVRLAEITQMRCVDLQAEPRLKPKWKLCGTSLPGHQSGWFTLCNGERGYLFLTGTPDVVALKLRSGQLVLLNLTEPELFLAALRESGVGAVRTQT